VGFKSCAQFEEFCRLADGALSEGMGPFTTEIPGVVFPLDISPHRWVTSAFRAGMPKKFPPDLKHMCIVLDARENGKRH